MPPNMTPIIPPSSHIKTSSRASQNNQQQNNSEEPKENSTKSKSLRVKSYPNWPITIDFDDKEEVLTIDAKGNVKLVSGSIQTIDVWSNNGVKYYVEFNDLYQPLRKGGQMLVRFIGSIAKVEQYCPLGEGEWPNIDGDLKAKMVGQIRVHYKNGVKGYKWTYILSYIAIHIKEDEHGKKMSLLALWIKSHSAKDGTFLPGTVTEDFVDDAKAKIEMLRTVDPSKSEQEIENAAFEDTMHCGKIPERPVGYGLGVRKSDIYGVHGVIRKQGYGKVRERTVVMESVKEEVSAISKKK
ncbi:hypothetical protein SOVF_124390 [Spinacia oleracea]|nr:hypothetical protein SOVF_124390 [Spinacia oleracea]